ncbi:phage-shock protein [Lentilactobacillus otakiensis]|uniref:Uncharacterized protein n=1 Tax=Lentilactobacillus otakiensis DSM 19908 = JCM 15040 TaxID=1423780 RepID=S4NN74_9LACO|nr:hypothetical protein [Lentilactobacillus otakiensis]KRL10955.1 phage shock protein G domain protein [Lentilactobacillus otakiensis DSM 19908 = JCM 15040]MBZ3777188.1 phage-shock protein [Lentilactobacillus otakiensis]MDV3517785.1 phage-shock protein [Lentilactobacillus otakiensis]GAD17296.1 hypothetical protein LOT_1834 [Lentilactobacillus otakiensis DSM 19908 = JCM 15040]
MTFNWKYAAFTNTPLFITLVIYIVMKLFKIDPIWLILVIILTWILWYAYAGWKIYNRHPEFNYHNYQRGPISILLATLGTIGFLFLIIKLDLIQNIALFITWLLISNYLVDGFARYKSLQ